uniref:Glycosyl transferase family 25 domain-containing protein n=1 Tax=viral metagenome TaxID=1070528 RepID=A0A6C0DZP4_9ZZZZ
MEESPNRLEQMNRQIPIIGKPFQIIKAINGKKLTKEELKLYCTTFGNTFCTYGMLGCFLSHQKTWKTMLKNNDKYALIMEDDCKLVKSFQKDLKLALDDLFKIDPLWDFLYVGSFGASDPDHNYNLIHSFSKIVLPNIKNAKQQPNSKYIFIPEAPIGFHCYIISNQCAKKLLYYLDKASYHVDVKFLQHSEKFNIYACKKNLGYQLSTPESSSLTQYDFPVTVNYFLDNIKDRHKISISYYFCAPFLQLFHIPLNVYITLLILIGISFPKIIPYILSFLLIELMVQPNNFNVILFIFMLLIIFNF